MRRLVVLGATGMLGSEAVRIAEVNSIPVVAISRSSEVPFDAESMEFEQVARKLGLSESDWLLSSTPTCLISSRGPKPNWASTGFK